MAAPWTSPAGGVADPEAVLCALHLVSGDDQKTTGGGGS
jgi:hypothetical protein